MKNMKFWRTALVATLVLTVMLSVTGGTIAWFTDEVTSAANVIEAGNLDVKLSNDDGEVGAATKLFTLPALWEPGAVAWENLTVVNEGNLALVYEMTINTANENWMTEGDYRLSDVLKVGVVDGTIAENAERQDVLGQVSEWKSFSAYKEEGKLLPADSTLTVDGAVKGSKNYGVVIYWQPGANDNNWNVNNNKATNDDADYLHVDLGIRLNATQLMAESDSFGSEYDEDAHWVDTNWYTSEATEYTIRNFGELAGLAQIVNGTGSVHDTFEGKTVYLGANIDMKGIEWTPIGRIGTTSTDFTYAFKGTFDGKDYTVSNLEVSNEGWAGLFGLAYKADIKNVKIENVTINSNRMAGALVGQLYGSIANCHVTNADIMVVPNAVGDSYDNGDKVGGIVGWLGDNGNNRTLTDCSATNVEITAYRDVAGIAGYVASTTTVKNNSVKNATIAVDQQTNHYGVKDQNAGFIVGRKGGTIVEENNNYDTESVITATYMEDGMVLKRDAEGTVKLYLVPADYTSDTVKVPEGVTAIGNYAFAYNNNVKTVNLASTVRDLGRGFESSTVEKVVLNEGLTTISSRAFKSTTNLEEVVISSTVTVIADNAFQKSGIKKIVIPANVETIGETAFGASLIEKVTFEGNTAIQGYAFRGCTELRTVILKGDDVTFIPSKLNGRNSCWFCNGESNNPNTSNIDFYVENETVAARVKTAMGAEANNTKVYVNGVLDTE